MKQGDEERGCACGVRNQVSHADTEIPTHLDSKRKRCTTAVEFGDDFIRDAFDGIDDEVMGLPGRGTSTCLQIFARCQNFSIVLHSYSRRTAEEMVRNA